MEIHYKCTTWCKLKLPNGVDKERILQKLNEGYTPNDIAALISEKLPDEDIGWETIDNTEEFMTVEENDGESTIELMEWQPGIEGLKCIWDNSYESELKRKENE